MKLIAPSVSVKKIDKKSIISLKLSVDKTAREKLKIKKNSIVD